MESMVAMAAEIITPPLKKPKIEGYADEEEAKEQQHISQPKIGGYAADKEEAKEQKHIFQSSGGHQLDENEVFVDEWEGYSVPDDDDLEKYYRQIEESGGYDIDRFVGMETINAIRPDSNPNQELYLEMAAIALADYNKDKHEDQKLELLRVIKVNAQVGGYPQIYMTFEAADSMGHPKIYQAFIEVNDHDEVKQFREKPPQKA